MKRVAMVLAVAAIAGGCESDTGGTLSDALCADIKSGINPMQMFAGMRDRYDTGADMAEDTFGHALVGCPEIFDDPDNPWTVFYAGHGMRP